MSPVPSWDSLGPPGPPSDTQGTPPRTPPCACGSLHVVACCHVLSREPVPRCAWPGHGRVAPYVSHGARCGSCCASRATCCLGTPRLLRAVHAVHHVCHVSPGHGVSHVHMAGMSPGHIMSGVVCQVLCFGCCVSHGCAGCCVSDVACPAGVSGVCCVLDVACPVGVSGVACWVLRVRCCVSGVACPVGLLGVACRVLHVPWARRVFVACQVLRVLWA